MHDVKINFIEIEKSISIVEKDIEVNEREITEMEEEFVNLDKLHSDGETEKGARYLSSFSPLSLSINQEVSSVSMVLWHLDICTFTLN